MSQNANSTSFWQQFLRNTGLGVLNDIYFRLHGRRHRNEQKKVVINTSPWTALSRCGVHVLPVLVSVSIIAINVRQTYIGVDFISLIDSETLNIALLQTAAKLQELLIIASLATIVYQLLRDELLYGDGIPLGLIGAGIDFTKLSFFWSPEVLGSVRTLFKGNRVYRKIQLGLFLVLAGAIALLAGPASAVLLVPRKQDWPAGGTYLPLSNDTKEMFPLNLSADASLRSMCTSSNAMNVGICPSGGYRSIWLHYANVDHSNFLNVIPPFARDLSGNRYYWSVQSPQPVSLSTISLGRPQGGHFTIQPHLSISVLLNQIMEAWWKALLHHKKISQATVEDRQAVSSKVYCPLVNVRCGSASILTASNRSVPFPLLNSDQSISAEAVLDVIMPNDPTNQLRFTWMHLPSEYSAATTGAIFQSPWEQTNKTRLVVGCSVQAQWVPAQLRMEAYNFWQGWYPKNITYEEAIPKKGSSLPDRDGLSSRDAISLDDTWLETLTPQIHENSDSQSERRRSTIESILDVTGLLGDLKIDAEASSSNWRPENDPSRNELLESVIGSVFADGLARVNVERLYHGNEDPSHQRLQDMVTEDRFEELLLQGKRALKPLYKDSRGHNDVKVNFAISGLSYRLTLVQKLAMLVLILHMAVAVAHTVWTVGRKKSSASWDSITEILVLAQNSKPAYGALKNTAAGVQHSKTFAKKVVIRPTKLPSESEPDHLELLVDEEVLQADGAMTEMQDACESSAASTAISISQSERGAPDSHGVVQSSTWPRYGHHSDLASLRSLDHSADVPSSNTDLPLLEPLSRASTDMADLRIKDGHAYG